MRINKEYAEKFAKELQDRIRDMIEAGRLGDDLELEQASAYSDHYLSRDDGIYLELRLGRGRAEVGIKVQVLTDDWFNQELEDQELDEQP